MLWQMKRADGITCMAIIHCAQLPPYMEHLSCSDTPTFVIAEAMSSTSASVSS